MSAWQSGDPPPLADFLPAEPAALRPIVLVELIKVDMERRLRSGAPFKMLEAYQLEFTELADSDIPCDLIYEEYHLRRMSGETVDSAAYLKRFPRQAERLRLLGLDRQRTTSLTRPDRRPVMPQSGESIDDFDLLAQLGQGTFARVYLARQRSLERLVALKISDDRGASRKRWRSSTTRMLCGSSIIGPCPSDGCVCSICNTSPAARCKS